jgi:hypothetical protein
MPVQFKQVISILPFMPASKQQSSQAGVHTKLTKQKLKRNSVFGDKSAAFMKHFCNSAVSPRQMFVFPVTLLSVAALR